MFDFETLITNLRQHFSGALVVAVHALGDWTLTLNPPQLVEVCRWLKEDEGNSFTFFSDLCGVDNQGEQPRFEVVIHLLSLKYRARLGIKVKVPDADLTIPSLAGVWRGANWFEREAYDMLGIRFEGHPNLTRILMPDDYSDFPLRKEHHWREKNTPGFYQGRAEQLHDRVHDLEY